MELKSIDVSNDEIYSQQEHEQILEKIKSFYENKLAEKDNHITFLENTTSSEIVLRDDLIEKLKKELAEKDKEIQLAIINEQLKSDLYLEQIDELKKEIEELKEVQNGKNS